LRGSRLRSTIHDVQAEAANITQSDKAIDRQQHEHLQRLEGVHRTLKAGFQFDVLTPHYRRRYMAVLGDIAETVQILIASFRSAAVNERVPRDEDPS
jgi:hypothetical protein